MRLIFWISIVIFTSVARADAPSLALSSEVPPTATCAKISLDASEIACLEKGVGSLSAVERANVVEKRLRQLADDPSFDSQRIKAQPFDAATNILAGETVILSLMDGDTEEVVSLGRTQAADLIVRRTRQAIETARQLKSPEAVLTGVAYTLLAALALAALLFSFRWAFPRIYAVIRAIDGRYVKTLKISSLEVFNSTRIVGFLIWFAQAIRIALTLVSLYLFVSLVFSFFPWTASLTPKLFGYVIDPLLTVVGVAIGYIPNLFFVIAICVVTHYVLRAIRFVFAEIGSGALQIEGFYREWADPTYKLVRVLVFAFALVMAFPYLPGSKSEAFQGISVFLGILLSLGSSSAIANVVAGVVITYMRPFKVGDRVKIADTIGDVMEKNLLVTRIRTIKNVETTIPNSMVLGSHIVNYSSTAEKDGLILNTTVTLGYEVPWKAVHESLLEAARRTDRIDHSKKSFVFQIALNDFTVSYELNAYTSFPNSMAAIYSDLHQNILDCCNEKGIEIMSPHYTNLRDGNETTIPSSFRTNAYEAPRFRVESRIDSVKP